MPPDVSSNFKPRRPGRLKSLRLATSIRCLDLCYVKHKRPDARLASFLTWGVSTQALTFADDSMLTLPLPSHGARAPRCVVASASSSSSSSLARIHRGGRHRKRSSPDRFSPSNLSFIDCQPSFKRHYTDAPASTVRSGALSIARLSTASSAARRRSSAEVSAPSSRSHIAISSSTLATIRCCSASGGKGTRKFRSGFSATVG